MSNCSRCGATLREGSRFCLSCGETVAAPRLSTADFLAGSVQPPARGPAPAAPPVQPAAEPGWTEPGPVPPARRAAPAELPPVGPLATAPEVVPLPVGASAVRNTTPSTSATAVLRPDDLERALARSKSYIAPAVLVGYLYTLFYLPGLIVNILYLNEAKHMEQVAGEKLPGTGCLATLMWAGLLVAAGVILLVWTVFGSVFRSLF